MCVSMNFNETLEINGKLLQNMCISSHCTIAEHAYGTCLNGYAHFSSLFLCAINVAIWGKLKSKRFEI